MTAEEPAESLTRAPSALELASTPVVAVRGDIDAMSALGEMYRNEVHHLAVVSGDAPTGLVAAVDLLFGIAGRMPDEVVYVAALCRSPAPWIEDDDSVAVAAHRMVEARTDAVLVMAGGDVRGVLTAVDLVRAVAEGGSRRSGETHRDEPL